MELQCKRKESAKHETKTKNVFLSKSTFQILKHCIFEVSAVVSALTIFEERGYLAYPDPPPGLPKIFN